MEAQANQTNLVPVAKSDARVKVPEWIQLRLWVKSGGRCEFNGCNVDLYTERLTLKADKLANVAHIVAASQDGPRGDDPLPLNERNDFENLMLVCQDHHSHFDKRYVGDYPVALLRNWKSEHEDRIEWLMSLSPNLKTKVIRLRARIGSEPGNVAEKDIRQAILPRYPLDRDGVEIDLTTIPETVDGYWEVCKQAVSKKLSQLQEASISGSAIEHVSVFAFAPIPLLIHLGRCIGNKIPSSFYQRHRDTQNWSWKNSGGLPANYQIDFVQDGTRRDSVILVLSLSGTIDVRGLPPDVTKDRAIYVMTLQGQPPNTGFLRTVDDLERFRAAYQNLLGEIRACRPEATEIHLFPAIPIPVALTCGRELLEKSHPSLLVYDYNKNNGEFLYTLRVN